MRVCVRVRFLDFGLVAGGLSIPRSNLRGRPSRSLTFTLIPFPPLKKTHTYVYVLQSYFESRQKEGNNNIIVMNMQF